MFRNYLITISCILLINVSKAFPQQSASQLIKNEPLESLAPPDRLMNKKYILNKTADLCEKDKIAVLVAMLKDKESCYLPREALIDTGIAVLPEIRRVALDGNVPMAARAESVKVLYGLDDGGFAGEIIKGSEFKTPFTDVEFEEDMELTLFCKNVLELSIKDMNEKDKVDRLCEYIKDPNRNCLSYLAKNELIKIGGSRVLAKLISLAKEEEANAVGRVWALMVIKEMAKENKEPFLGDLDEIKKGDKNPEDLRELASVIIDEIGLNKKAVDARRPEFADKDKKSNCMIIIVFFIGFAAGSAFSLMILILRRSNKK